MYRKIIEFQKITKYPLIFFLEKYSYFNENCLTDLKAYFSGSTTSIDNDKLQMLSSLIEDNANLISVVNNFSNKMNDCGFWELLDYLESLNDNINKIAKLPKYYHVTKTVNGYKPVKEITGSVGGMKTFEDVENELKYDNFDNEASWVDIMRNNDIEETDWEIDELKQVKYTTNSVSVQVNTIIDVLKGDNVYGKDISKKIAFEQNDLEIVKYLENIKQKSLVLLNLKKGDVPEIVDFGVDNKFLGSNVKSFSYHEIFTQIENNFLQDDIFSGIEIYNLKFNGDSLEIEVNIKTKYDYSLIQNLNI